MPPICLGNGNLTVHAKFAMVMHVLRLESDCWNTVARIMDSTQWITTDFGAEAKLGTVPAYCVNDIFVHWDERRPPLGPQEPVFGCEEFGKDVVETECGMEAFDPPIEVVSLEYAMRFQGFENILHNNEYRITSKMPRHES